ncbi:STAS domain-containing protein [Echinicola sp. CAU 1574]|uniref:Anti-sigma factor antagonist n=1 Tax=Echinicola arenosa TaxID=2774144 RepID=A0ABR9AR47_9BACT|nr:STAS domain-containing protein [Echinicola arenosa]MBD8491251.1 STAS domain-containing protein [Echinicola arenosa]
MKLSYNSQREGDSIILSIKGDLIGDEAGPRLVEIISDALQSKIKNCIIDLQEVRYISSSGIGVLITMLTKMRNAGGDVYLASPSEHVKKLLIITKLNNIFTVYESLDEAKEKVK